MTARQSLLRRTSAILVVVWLGVVVASFMRRQIERRPTVGPVDLGEGVRQGEEQPIRVHKGFEYTDTIGAEPNFRVAARETVQFASGWYELRDVEVWLYHRGEAVYGLTAQRARFNPARREAVATGDVQLSLRGGVVLRAAGCSLKGPERRLETQGTATFAGPGWGGVAAGAICSLADDTLELIGGVSVAWRQGDESAPSLVLLAPRLNYTRQQALLRFPEGLYVMQGQLRLQAASGEVQLREAEGSVQHARLDEPVEVSGKLADGAQIEVTAGTAELEALEGERYRLAAAPASGEGWVRMVWRNPVVGAREVAAWRLVGEGARGAWEWLEGQGLVCGSELQPHEQVRQLEAQRLRITFKEGELATAEAEEQVRLETGSSWATGERLSFSLSSRTFVLRPGKQKWVEVGTDEIECQVGSLETGENGETVARGRVSGTLRRGSLWGKADTPVRFAAESVRVARGGDELTLEGDGRLWQGDRMVRADRLLYNRKDEVVLARGKVLTQARSNQGPGWGGEMRLRARALNYQRLAALATYEGDVVLEDPRSLTRCQRLEVTMSAEGEVLVATLEGGVEITDRESGRVLRGRSARLDIPNDLLDLWGTPVLVQESGGNQVKADHLQWRRATGTVTVVGAPDRPSETLFHPPPTPTPSPVPVRRQP